MKYSFKETLDSYEDFIDEYCVFMEKYSNNPSDAQLIAQYSEFESKFSETMENMEALGDDLTNDAESEYYLEVTTRISKKLLEVSGSM